MTANELADELDMVRIELTLEAATMLREQQEKIEALNKLQDDLFAVYREVLRLEAENEALKKELALQRLSDIGQEIEQAMICTKCNNTGWVCECHPNKEAHKCCGGAGMPCECTKKSE
jgi:hypothetical protein